jgi:molecular chaperone HtpG
MIEYKLSSLPITFFRCCIKKFPKIGDKVARQIILDLKGKLISKEDTAISKLSDDETTKLKEVVETYVPKPSYNVQLEALDSNASPFIITQPEFMRRMKEMSQSGGGGGMFGMGNMPDMYNLVVNTNSELATSILNNSDKEVQERLVKQALDLARISQGLLKGEELTAFVKRSFELIK